MSTPFPKSKEKRPRSSSEPNKSFVKNVTSRVSGLLPATITKWFSSPSSNTNGSAQVAETTDSSTEDEAPESPITTQPPAKKIRYTSPGEFSQHLPVETTCTSTNTDSIDETYTVHSPIVKANSREESIFASTRAHSSNDDTTEETNRDTNFKPQNSVSVIEHSTARKRKSIFGNEDDSFKKQTYSKSGNVRDPYFKPSLLSSPFYVGRTMYGGASSSYLTPTSFKKRTISVTNETSNNDSVTMSHSARRVMDLLEHYSSPLIEAKRIPQFTREPKNFNNNSLPQSIQPYGPKGYSYKTQELYVPSVANILTIKRKSRLMDSTNAARQIIASHSSSSEYLPYSITSSGGDMSDEVYGDRLTTKVKSRLTRINRERNIEMESALPDTVNLPNVVLQIDKDNLPKFTFGPTSSQPQQSSSIQTPVIITPQSLKRSYESDKSDYSKVLQREKTFEGNSNNDSYKFSTPVQISNESNKTTSTPPKFSFGSPDKKISNTEKLEEVKTQDDMLPSITTNQTNLDNKLLSKRHSEWKCQDCWVTNKIDNNKCVCCGGQKTQSSPGKYCSICSVSMDRAPYYTECIDCEMKTKNTNDRPFMPKEPNNKTWKCSECWIDNKENAEKCVCCGGRNHNKVKPASVINSEKNVETEWKCNDCWIKNKNSLSKCAACGGVKPGSQAVSTNNLGNSVLTKGSPVKETQDNTFKNIAKAQNEKWECPLCLVRNESDRDICICCEARKPGTEKESHTKFNFHQPSEITFKFGIQPKNQESYSNIESEECNMGEESETNNNILPKTPTFNFGLSVKNSGDQSQSMDKHTEAPKLNFTFGLSKGDQVSPGRNTIFGIASKPVETGKSIEENPQEVPQVFTRLQSNEPVKKNLGLFNTPVTSQVTSDVPGLVSMNLLNQNSTVKKDLPFLGSSGISTTSSEATTQSNFTFPNIMPATNMFATAPTTTTTASNILPGPLSMGIPASTTISLFEKPNVTHTTPSFFKKTEPLPTLGASLFSKTESNTTTTSTTTSGPLGTMQPIFNFGGQGSVPQAEKPKFNFNFTNNKTESATIFQPAFGATSDNSAATNKFNLPSNILGGNTLSGNSLSTTTQMNTANPLTTGNSLTTPSGSTIFGSTVPKEPMWPPSNNNMFANNNTTNGEQNAPTFTFGSATAFSTNSAPFGSTTQQTQPNNSPFGGTTQQAQTNNISFGGSTQQAPTNNIPFGSTAQQAQPNNAPFGSTPQQAHPNNSTLFGSNPQQTPSNNTAFGTTTQQTQPSNVVAFGSTQQTQPAQPPQNVFGMGSQTTTSQPTMFGNPLQSQSPPNIFGSLQVPNNPMPMGLFGAPNQVPTPSFGAMNPPMPTFETSSLVPPHPTPAAFNFGGQPSTGIFGFGQHQQPGQPPSQPENPGIYGFGGPPGAPRVQFTIGSAPDTTVRRVRKATRRTQR